MKALVLALVVFLSGCGSTLHTLVGSGDAEAVQRAIDSGANVNGNKWHGWPINKAIENDDLEMVQLLHRNGATIAPGHISIAAKAKARTTYEYLAGNGGDLIGCFLDTDYPGWWGGPGVGSILPPLGSAIMRNDAHSVADLLNLGAPVEADCEVPTGMGNDYRFSSILAAGIAGDPAVIESLIRAGAEPNRLSAQGQTPLSLAAERGHYNAVRVLLANGAFHTYTNQIKQPIEYAIDAGNEEIVELLVYAGAVRPQRRDFSEARTEAGRAVWEGVKFVAELYVIYLGARYSGYDSNYGSQSGSKETGRLTAGALTGGSERSGRDDKSGECASDFDCDGLEICVKKPLHTTGICVDDGGATRLSRDYDSVQSGFARSDSDADPKDCPLGTRWDLIYQACIN